MATVDGIGASAFTASRTPRRDRDQPRAGGAPESESRALIAVAPATRSEAVTGAAARPLAAFLAQLIATQTHAPQTRARRRAEPGDVMAVYTAAAGRRTMGRALKCDA